MGVWLDLEWDEVVLSPAERSRWAEEWLLHVADALGYMPGVYSNPNHLKHLELPNSIINEAPLWLASRGKKPAFDPDWGWSEEDLILWQYSSSVMLGNERVDANQVTGDLSRLHELPSAVRDLIRPAADIAYEYKFVNLGVPLQRRGELYTKICNDLGHEGWKLIHLDAPTIHGAYQEHRLAVFRRIKR